MHLLGYDVGTSSIKASLVNAETGLAIASATSPKAELPIQATQPGWAEQDPETWWHHVKAATGELATAHGAALKDVGAIGISYQMHGLVLVDKKLEPLRPAIIWCDGRAASIGEEAFRELGPEKCLSSLLNSPGNFTASRLNWVRLNERDIFGRIHKAMLPGDYIAMRLTGRVTTTASGLSEWILWDFEQQGLSTTLLEHYGIAVDLLGEVVGTFAPQGEVAKTVAAELGVPAGTPVGYRAGDQPNNAFSLGVLEPGQLAATAGTSGVVYGITDQANHDTRSRVNTFVHVNHEVAAARYGVLLCVAGTGILNSWLKHNVSEGRDYDEINRLAGEVPIGAEGLVVLPYGNGAERTLEDRDIGASIHHLNFNIHKQAHLLRAAQEGIVFALNYGCDILRSIGVEIKTVRAGRGNMFLSPLFVGAFAAITGARVELYNTDGAQGAALAAGVGAGIYGGPQEAFAGLTATETIDPDPAKAGAYRQAYEKWLQTLEGRLAAE